MDTVFYGKRKRFLGLRTRGFGTRMLNGGGNPKKFSLQAFENNFLEGGKKRGP